MRNTNKKGFTVVELVIVIAVIAILAAVLIPTFAGIIHKANIATDTAVAKNLNTAAISAGADTFEEAIAAVREAGYLIANLNAKADGCYFVWEDDSNQFLLYDLKNEKILYSNTEVSGDPDASWCFAVSNSEVADSVKAVLSGITIKKTIASVADLKDAIAAGGTIYMDESVVLDNENLLEFANGQTAILELGNSSVNTDGSVKDTYPVYIGTNSNVTINGGIIGAAGSNVDVDGDVFTAPICTDNGSHTKINGTTFNASSSNAMLVFSGESDLVNVVINSEGQGVHTTGSGETTLENVTIKAISAAIWACNLDYTDETNTSVGHVGESLVTVVSGKYEGGNSTYGVIVSCGGDIVITGGTFISNGPTLVSFVDTTGTVSIQGGTFNMDPSEYLANGYVANQNADGMWVVSAD